MNIPISLKKNIIDLVENVLFAIAISAIIYLVLIVPNNVEGQSMEPNFHQNDLILTNKTIEWLGSTSLGKHLDYDYKRGDVIIFHNSASNLIKRVIAVEGDSVRVQNDKIYVNGMEIKEEYLPTTTRTNIIDTPNKLFMEGDIVTVPQGHYFAMGDNRENSKDSRYVDVGFISRQQIVGKVFLRYWPLSKFGIIRRGEYQEIPK